ncbi:putative quinol monooxygenase [Pseudonocardia phyllosphaerae]|uniref:putative quinol monooxygenase n=1 Tax=Pseudonocardia phyllosphaerae TaxID=3390502 RepID=UPI00397B0C17
MPAVVVIAVFRPAEGRQSELVEALRGVIPAVHDEAGCELYAIHDADDGSVVLVEKWSSRDDLAAHSNGEPIAALRRAVDGLVAGPPEVTRMDALPAGTAEQGVL